jgi:hypothetical protein
MRPLSAPELLEVWEHGEYQHAIDKALTLLAVCCPERNPEELAGLSIGQRDALLFALRELMVGPLLDAFAECPACHEHLEFSLAISNILSGAMIPDDNEIRLEAEGFEVRFRLPNSIDFAAIANLGIIEGEKTLLHQCVRRVVQDGNEIALESLPEKVTSAMVKKMQEYDPLAEVMLSLECPACGNHWPMLLDIVSFFWAELEAQAKQLLRQVHILARYYGWQEADIISMSAQRRYHYLDMVTS